MGERNRGADGQRVPAFPSHPFVELETESSPFDSASRKVTIHTFPGPCLKNSFRQVLSVPPVFRPCEGFHCGALQLLVMRWGAGDAGVPCRTRALGRGQDCGG